MNQDKTGKTPHWVNQNKEYPNHYEVTIDVSQMNINHLTNWLTDLEDEYCIIALDGGSYIFESKRERLQFVLGMELMFAAVSEDLRETKLS